LTGELGHDRKPPTVPLDPTRGDLQIPKGNATNDGLLVCSGCVLYLSLPLPLGSNWLSATAAQVRLAS